MEISYPRFHSTYKFIFHSSQTHLRESLHAGFPTVCDNPVVERLTRIDRASAIAAAVAHDINDEMTIILNGARGAMDLLEPGHPARLLLHDLAAATQRCVWKTSTVLNYSARNGAYRVDAPLESLADERLDPEQNNPLGENWLRSVK
jgi:hypothetical protein